MPDRTACFLPDRWRSAALVALLSAGNLAGQEACFFQTRACIPSPFIDHVSGASSGDLAPWGPVQLDGWYAAVGSPTWNGNGVYMWSYSGVTHGEAISSCYHFRAGNSYLVSVQVAMADGVPALPATRGRFIVQATNGNFTRPQHASNATIADLPLSDTDQRRYQFTYNAQRDHRILWLYPFMAEDPTGPGTEYAVIVSAVDVEQLYPAPSVTVSGDSVLLQGPARTGHWSWSPQQFLIAASVDSSMVRVASCDSVLLRAVHVSPCGTRSSDSVEVIFPGRAPATVIAQATHCHGGSVLLPNGTLADSSGTYRMYVPTDDGCSYLYTLVLTVLPADSTTRDLYICPGAPFPLPDGSTATAPGTFRSTLRNTFGCDSVITTRLFLFPLSDTTYTINTCVGTTLRLPDGSLSAVAGDHHFTLPDRHGCDSLVHLTVQHYPAQQSVDSITLLVGESHILGDGRSIHEAGSYATLYADQHGCDSLHTTVLEQVGYAQLYVPNAFSPNGDGVNDHLRIPCPTRIWSRCTLVLYDRWGAEVHRSEGPLLDWDGHTRGQAQPGGVYPYRIEASDQQGRWSVHHGQITLLR